MSYKREDLSPTLLGLRSRFNRGGRKQRFADGWTDGPSESQTGGAGPQIGFRLGSVPPFYIHRPLTEAHLPCVSASWYGGIVVSVDTTDSLGRWVCVCMTYKFYKKF